MDYEVQIIRVKVDGVQVVAVTGYSKAVNYAQQYIGKHVILECKTDLKTWDLGIIGAEKQKEEPKEYPTGTSIMGQSVLTPYQMVSYVENTTTAYKLNCTLLELATLFIEEGKLEGVRGDIAFCQSLHETGYFRYGGQVLPEQNNYAGIGATNDSPIGKGAWFDTPQLGVRAQIQHLKAYACTEPLNNPCVDPRFSLVKRGRAPYWEWLGRDENPSNADRLESDRQGWAVPGPTYGHSIINIYEKIKLLPTNPLGTGELTIEEQVYKVLKDLSIIEEPIIEEPVIEEPVIEEPIIEEPVIEEPVIEEPVIEEPVDLEIPQLTEKQKNTLVDLIMKLVAFFVSIFKKK